MRFGIWLVVAALSVSNIGYGSEYPESRIEVQIGQVNSPLQIDISQLKAGESKQVFWGGLPVLVYHRTKADIARLENTSPLADPSNNNSGNAIASNHYSATSGVGSQLYTAGAIKLDTEKLRSITPNIFVAIGMSPHSGCMLNIEPNNPKGQVFSDPCTSTYFDAAGRIFSGTVRKNFTPDSPAKYNLLLLPYHFESAAVLSIGPQGGYKALPVYKFDIDSLLTGLDATHKLMVAARFNDHARINAALQEGADVRYWAWGEGSPLDSAIIGSSSSVVRRLLSLGALPSPNSESLAESTEREDIIGLLNSTPNPYRKMQ
ncbi:MAG: hypothetical protein WA056_02670 [Gallionella sp.]